MAEIVGAEAQCDRWISADPANGILASLNSDGTVSNLITRSLATSDVSYFAPTNSSGTNTRRHLFDRPLVSTGTGEFTSLTLSGALSGATTGAFSSNLTVGGTAAVTGVASFSSDVNTGKLTAAVDTSGLIGEFVQNNISGYGVRLRIADTTAAAAYALKISNLAESVDYFKVMRTTGRVGDVEVGTGRLLVGTTDTTGIGAGGIHAAGASKFGGAVTLSSTLTVTGAVSIGNTVNAVSPTSPNRTITMSIGGTTYYLHAKTTND